MKRAKALYRLQAVEGDIAQKSRRLKEVEAVLGDSDLVKKSQDILARAEARLRSAQGETLRLDLENRSLQEETATTEKQLYGGRVTNPKELASLQDKIKNLKERRRKLEDSLLDMMLEAEEAETDVAASQQNLRKAQNEWAASQSDLAAERDTLTQDLSALRSERETLRKTIASSDLEVFEDLRRRKGGRGVVKMLDGACQGCGVSVPISQAKAVLDADELIFCGSCERILCS